MKNWILGIIIWVLLIISIRWIAMYQDKYSTKYRIQIFYINGTTDTLNIIYNYKTNDTPILNNGCLYYHYYRGAYMGDDNEYSGQIICGVSYYKIISKKIVNRGNSL
jgi:hypothetical protein